MTPADAAARADRDAAATLARLDRERLDDDVLDLFLLGAMVENRAYSNDTDLLRRLLADTERDIYAESVAALGNDPMSERSQAAEKDER